MMSVGQKIKTGVIGNDVVTALDGYPDEIPQAKIWILPAAQQHDLRRKSTLPRGKSSAKPQSESEFGVFKESKRTSFGRSAAGRRSRWYSLRPCG